MFFVLCVCVCVCLCAAFGGHRGWRFLSNTHPRVHYCACVVPVCKSRMHMFLAPYPRHSHPYRDRCRGATSRLWTMRREVAPLLARTRGTLAAVTTGVGLPPRVGMGAAPVPLREGGGKGTTGSRSTPLVTMEGVHALCVCVCVMGGCPYVDEG